MTWMIANIVWSKIIKSIIVANSYAKNDLIFLIINLLHIWR